MKNNFKICLETFSAIQKGIIRTPLQRTTLIQLPLSSRFNNPHNPKLSRTKNGWVPSPSFGKASRCA